MVEMVLFFPGFPTNADTLYFETVEDGEIFFNQLVAAATVKDYTLATRYYRVVAPSILRPARMVSSKINCKDRLVTHSSVMEGFATLVGGQTCKFIGVDFHSTEFNSKRPFTETYLTWPHVELTCITALSVVSYARILYRGIHSLRLPETDRDFTVWAEMSSSIASMDFLQSVMRQELEDFGSDQMSGTMYNWPYSPYIEDVPGPVPMFLQGNEFDEDVAEDVPEDENHEYESEDATEIPVESEF